MTDKRRILFVDDDPSVLAALRNLFHRDRARWEVVFANSGPEALAELTRKPFDIVVSDMRMSPMDGVELLERVRAEWPRTARVMLSGSEDKAELARATAAVDELLCKPCDTKTLRATLERMMPPL